MSRYCKPKNRRDEKIEKITSTIGLEKEKKKGRGEMKKENEEMGKE